MPPPPATHKSRMEWHGDDAPSTSGRGAAAPPLALLLTWMSAAPRTVAQHAQLYRRLGFGVATKELAPAAVWVGPLAERNARVLLRELAAHLRVTPRPLVVVCFCGAAKGCYAPLLRLMATPGDADGAAVLACLACQIFDSSPVDFVSSVGVRLVTGDRGGRPTQPPLGGLGGAAWGAAAALAAAVSRTAAGALAAALDFVAYERFERERAEMWSTFARLPGRPTAFFFSWDDDVAPAAPIHGLAGRLRSAGVPVLEQSWPESRHVLHLKLHRAEYEAALVAFLEQHDLLGPRAGGGGCVPQAASAVGGRAASDGHGAQGGAAKAGPPLLVSKL